MPSYSGFVNGDGPTSLTTSPTCAATVSGVPAAGVYAINCSGAVDSNYSFDYVSGMLTVKPAALIITASSPTITYGQSVPAISASYSGFENGDGPGSLTGAPTCNAQAPSVSPPVVSPPAGTYTTNCSGALDANYTITYKAGTLTVNPVALTISAPSPTITYGQSVPTLTPTYSGFENGDSPASLSTQPTCSAAVSADPPPASSYAVTCSGAVDSNYTITYKAGTLTVKPAVLTVSAPSPTITYGQSVPTLTPTYSGFENGDSPASLSTQPTCSAAVSADPPPASSYAVTCSGAVDSNYTITYKAGTLTVKPAVLTVAGPNVTMEYGAPVPALPPTYSGFVNGDTVASLTRVAVCTTTASSASAVKATAYPVTCSGAVDPNYVFTYVAGGITVVKAPTALTATPAIIQLSPLHIYLFTLNATLTSQVTGAVLANQSVVFKAGTTTLCTTKTNSSGVATCKGSSGVNGIIKVIEADGYNVSFAGTADYLLSSAKAPLVN
jgi:hypothetical protein